MTGIKINICFWYLDETLIEEIIEVLVAGSYNPKYFSFRNTQELKEKLKDDTINLIIADFDLPDNLRMSVENVHAAEAMHIPFIYVVGEKNEERAADTLKRGVWDYLLKSQFVKLVPTVYSSQKYGKVLRNNKEVESDLHKSREHFRNLADNSPDVIMRFDRACRHIYVNKTIETLSDLKAEDYLGKSHSEMGVFSEDLVALWESDICKVFELGKPQTSEFDVFGLSYEWRLYPEYDTQGEVNTVLALARDVTETQAARRLVEETSERLDMAVKATSLGLWDWNIQTNKVYFSSTFFQMLDWEVDEFPHVYETWHGLVHKDDIEDTVAAVDQAIRDRHKAFEIEFRMQCKDGSYKWICSRGRSVQFDEDGNTSRLVGTHEDITLRKRNEEIQNALFNISNAVNTTKNLDELYELIRKNLGRIIDTTNCFLALYNAENNTLTMPFHRDEQESFTEFPAGQTLTGYVVNTGVAQLVDLEKTTQLEEEGLIELVGTPCVSWLGVPLRIDDKIIGVFVVQSYSESVVYTNDDVSILEFASDQIAVAIERKRDQDNILKNQEKQRRIFESSPDPIVVLDSNGIVIDYNTALLEVVKVSNEQVIGLPLYYFISKEQWRYAMSKVKQTWEEGYIKNIEFRIFRTDGSEFESEVSTGAIYDVSGEPESMVIMFKDISERKEAERNLLEAKEKAEEADRLKTAFLSNMSHEIRTPMNAIVGFSDLLNDESVSPESRTEFIAQINIGADNLMHLIDDIIDISKIEAGQVKINITECFIEDIVSEQIVMFNQNIERLGKDEVELKLNWEWPEEKLTICSDPFRIKQILSNLLGNAIKFTEVGSVVLSVMQQNEFVRFSVKDSGIGIEKSKIDVIFDRFMQGHVGKERLYGGTGLGLAISKNYVRLLGGEIGVESEPGNGAEFWFTLPYKGSIEIDSVYN